MKTKHGQQTLPEIGLPWLVVAELATWIGASFIWPLTSVYLNKRLGISLSVIGIVLFCNCAANMVGSTISGRLFDKFNPYPLIIGGMGLDTLVLLAMAFFHGWPIYWFWLVCTGFLGGWNGALVNSIATSLKKYPGRYIFNILYFSQNLGVVIGTLIVGYLYDYSIHLLFIIASCLFLIGTVVALTKFRPIIAYHAERKEKQKSGQAPTKAEPMPKANFYMTLGFFITLGVTWLMYMNWESNLSVYMVSLGIPFHLYSTLWTINAGIIVVVQLILARFPGIFKTIYQQIFFGIFMFAISWLTLIFAKTYPGFVLSMSILTLGESTAFSAIPAYVNDMSPYSSKGKYQGLTLVASGVGRAFGPLFGGTLIDLFGYKTMFVVASCGIFLCLIALIPLKAKLKDQVHYFR